MKVPDGEAYRSAIPNNASISSFDMYGDKMVEQPYDYSPKAALEQQLEICVHNSLRQWPCVLQAQELVLGIECI